MSEVMAGKELVIAESNAITKRSKPTLMPVGKGWVCSTGKFHPELAVAYIKDKPRNKWLSIGELSRVFTAANTIPGKKRVRKQLPAVFRRLLDDGEFLLYHTDASRNGRIESVKLLDITSELERQQAIPQLERMRKGQELSREKYDKARQVIALHERLAEEV